MILLKADAWPKLVFQKFTISEKEEKDQEGNPVLVYTPCAVPVSIHYLGDN